MKKLVQYVQDHFQQRVCRNTIRRVLKKAGLSWKKCKKLLGKVHPGKREEYLKTFLALYQQMCRGEVRLIDLDEWV